MMSDGPTLPRDSTVEQESTSLSEKSVIEETPVTRVEFNALSAELNEIRQKRVRIPNNEKLALDGQPGVAMHTPSLGEPRKGSRCYDWESKKGLVAIINNFTKENEKNYRKGTKEDEKKIRKFFQKYHPTCTILKTFLDKRKDEFNAAIDEIVEVLERGKKDISSFFLFIMSHGDQDCVTAYHGDKESSETLSINDDIISKFTKCIKGHPKVFVIQACQGQMDNFDVDRDVDEPFLQNPTDEYDELEDDSGSTFTLPQAADMLVAYATVRGYAAYRWKVNPGAWFITDLFDQLKKLKYSNYHIVELLTEVQYRVAKRDGVVEDEETQAPKTVKQMPCFMSSLRKRLYLLPQSTSS